MYVYSHLVEDEFDLHHRFFLTKREALASAQREADESDGRVEVHCATLAELPKRELVIALLNREGWLTRDEIVALVHPKGGPRP